MYPHERSLVKRLHGKPFALLGINSDKNLAELKSVLKKEAITWRSWWNGDGPRGGIAAAWGVHAWPTIYVLDHHGVVRFKDVREKQLDEAVDRLLREMARDVAARPSGTRSAARRTAGGPKGAPSGDDAHLAAIKLRFAKVLLSDGKLERARERLEEIVKKYPGTDAADEAKELLKRR